MAILFEIKHATTCSYAKPVTFGTHRAMFLPRRGARGRLLNWSARTNPPSRIRWISDSLSNSITEMELDGPGSELTFTFQFQGIHFGAKDAEQFVLERRAERVPVQYTPDEGTDLVGFYAPTGIPTWPLRIGRGASSPPMDKRLMFCSGCSTHSATGSPTGRGKRKGR